MLRATFSVDDQGVPRYDFSIENRSGWLVAKLDLETRYQKPGSETPLAEGQIDLTVNGGIKPDEVRELFYIPEENKQLWVAQEYPSATVKIRVLGIYDAEGNRIVK